MLIRWIAQRTDNDCGVACLAMLGGVSYEQARRSFGLIPEGGLYESHLLHWLNARGWLYQSGWPAARLSEAMADVAIGLALVQMAEGNHWLVVADGAVLDPDRMCALPASDYHATRFFALHAPATHERAA